MISLSQIQNKFKHKSSAAKIRYSFIISSLITAVIGGIWVTTLPARLAQFSESQINIAEDSEDFNVFFDQTKSQMGNVIDSTKDTLANEIQSTESMDSLNTTNTLPISEEDIQGNEMAKLSASTTTLPMAPSSEPVVSQVLTTTTTESVITPPIHIEPRIILIGTTSSQYATSTL